MREIAFIALGWLVLMPSIPVRADPTSEDPCLKLRLVAEAMAPATLSVKPAASHTPSFLLVPEGQWHDPSVVRLFVREPSGAKTPVNYIENQMQALTDHFDPWFRSENDTEVRALLEAMHRTACLGRDGNHEYYSEHDGRTSAMYQPGKMRDKMLDMYGLPLDAFVPLDMDIPKSVADKYAGEAQDRVSLPGIPDELAPQNHRDRKGNLVHAYPKSSKLKLYLDRMGDLLVQIKKLPKDAPRDTLLPLLSEYYQIAINAHLFHRANNSILMGQVNYILESRGMKGISHGDLDYAALILKPERFQSVLAEAIRRENP